MKYAVIINPGHNRVFMSGSNSPLTAEFELASSRFISAHTGDYGIEDIAGVGYFTFYSDNILNEYDIKLLSRLSFTYAVFTVSDGGSFTPIPLYRDDFIDEKVGEILKYTGKTNEIFTKMLINTAYFTSDTVSAGVRPRLLDPVAGKGTTMFEGLYLGADVSGIEIGFKPVSEGAAYFKKYLETERYKHTLDKKTMTVRGEKSFLYDFSIQRDKTEAPRSCLMISGSSADADAYFKKNTFDIIAGDLPYGVQHAVVTGERQSPVTRNAVPLLNNCLHGWYNVLKTGGAVALAYNQLTTKPDEVKKSLEAHGFEVCRGGGYDRFSHRVDASILRDIVCAKKLK